MRYFLKSQKLRVVLNGQISSCNNVEAALPQYFIARPLLLLIYINNFFDNLAFKPEHFLTTSLFSVVHDLTTKTEDLNNGLNQIKNSNFHGKLISFQILLNRRKKLYFPRKNVQRDHVPLVFNQTPVSQTNMQILLGMLFDIKLIYNDLQIVNILQIVCSTSP